MVVLGFEACGERSVCDVRSCRRPAVTELLGSQPPCSSPRSHVAAACKISCVSQRRSQEDGGSPTCMYVCECVCVIPGTTLALAPF